jgi:outer membrane autotransporter protein
LAIGALTTKPIAEENSVTISYSTVTDWAVGGYVNGYEIATAINNNVNIINSTIGTAMGGYVTYQSYNSNNSISNTAGNNVTINNSIVNIIFGGYANGLGVVNATYNNVTVIDSTVMSVIGGRAETTDAESNTLNAAYANYNNVTIMGGTVTHSISGGICVNYSGPYNNTAAVATYNTVTIGGGADLSAALISGGEASYLPYMRNADLRTGNTLNVKNSGMTAKGIYNFENLNFYLPETMTAGETMLSVTNSVDISSSTIGVGIDGTTSALNVDDTITLIEALGGLSADGINTRANGLEGIAKIYDFDLVWDTNRLYATTITIETNPQTKILSEGVAAGAIMALQGAGNINVSEGVFLKMFGGNTEYETGSSVKANVFGVVAGIGKKLDSTTLGAFIEYASGSYDTEYDNVSGSGDASAVGGGIMAKKEINDYYVKGFVRAGQLTNEYKNEISGLNADFDYNSMYYGFSLAGGRVFNAGDKLSIDTSARYSFTSIGGSDVTLPTDEKYQFDSVLSNIVTIEVAAEYKVSNWFTPYASLSYAYELSGDVNAKIDGFEIEAPSLNGGTFAVWLGASVKVMERLTVDLGGNLLSGVRNGVTGNLQIKFQF